MPQISENQIDQIAEAIGANEAAFKKAIDDFQEAQPVLFWIFISEAFEVLTFSEREYQLFVATVLFKAISSNQEENPTVTEDEIANIEEGNWIILQESKGNTFRDKLDVFFDNTPEEDLLAFIEDAVIDEEGEELSKEGQEVIFITGKTIMDCLLA